MPSTIGTEASDGPLDHFGYDAEARFDDGITVIVQIDVEDIDRQHVARIGALDGDRTRCWIGPGKAVAIVGGGGFDVLRATEPAAARIQRVDETSADAATVSRGLRPASMA